MQIIETEHLTKYYGKAPVVDSLSLSVPEGSVYGFIGPKRRGKIHHHENAAGAGEA